ncbi:transcription factor RAX2-like protein isoform X1 [Cinnamomum micranthum f. kanehirae]|uniref:Transcription factor RAX2-like protein isoform X1 n=1 Tax=Cinnamomum micranthum f. kanehirae TaxID=337451 RepID=A0A3S3NVV4_9MAGN|nr:transcription factor RAX2-like protein isoform X1 [Cinnamomum micranthum f. kanehirae]
MHAMKLPQDARKFEGWKQSDRRIVTWTPQLMEMSCCYCRWYTYLNSECKKGCWTEQEDKILCEAQKIYGNRWTEIAKVVSGRTDNAVKNRFSTLCKKQAKLQATTKENSNEHINLNNKRVIIQDRHTAAGTSGSMTPLKEMRMHISDFTRNCNMKERWFQESANAKQMQLRSPLAVLVQNSNVGNGPTQQHLINHCRVAVDDDLKVQGMFLRKNDSKVTALMQQSKFFSLLTREVNMENTSQSIENAWKVLHNFLARYEESKQLRCEILEMEFLLKNFKDLVEDQNSSTTESRQSLRQLDLHDESQGSSEYSTGSTQHWHPTDNKIVEHQSEGCLINHSTSIKRETENRQVQINGGSKEGCSATASIDKAAIMPSSDEPRDGDGAICKRSNTEFSSPLQMVPFFQHFEEGIPSPRFTDSERHFLLKTLGLASPSVNANTNPSCRRALLHSL